MLYLILAMDTTRAKSRSAFSAGKKVQAAVTACAIDLTCIVFAFADSDVFLLLLLVPEQDLEPAKMTKRKTTQECT